MSGTDKGPARAALYCRMSVAEMGDLEKVDRQEADCRTVCDRMNWTPAQVFVDNNRSAWQRNRSRPAWDAMLEGVREGRFDAIVVYHGDRLIRQPYDLELLLNLASEKGIRLASPTGTRNLDSADDRFILRIEAAQACRESDNTSRRVRRAKEARRNAGLVYMGRTRAFGRNGDNSIRQDEAELIRDVFARLMAGEAQSALWREWVQREVPTVRGGQWWYTTFRQMLRRADLAGLVSYKGEIVGPATNIEAIVSREVWETVQSILDGTASRHPDRPPARANKYLLTGFGLCGGCGRGLGVGYTRGIARYRCTWPGCPQPMSRNMTYVDEYVIAYALERLGDDALWERIRTAKAADAAADQGVAADLEALEARRRMVLAQFAEDDTLSPAELSGVLRRLDERIDGVRSRISSTYSSSVLEGLRGLDRTGWDALPLGRQRSVVQALCAVRLLPTPRRKGFDKDAVEIKDL